MIPKGMILFSISTETRSSSPPSRWSWGRSRGPISLVSSWTGSLLRAAVSIMRRRARSSTPAEADRTTPSRSPTSCSTYRPGPGGPRTSNRRSPPRSPTSRRPSTSSGIRSRAGPRGGISWRWPAKAGRHPGRR